MKKLILNYGQYAHGTKHKQGDITENSIMNSEYEYALRPQYGDNCWTELLKYRFV